VLPVLPVVVPVLLEALSGLEDARLNYIEQVGVSDNRGQLQTHPQQHKVDCHVC
jgi:hypothetical protein